MDKTEKDLKGNIFEELYAIYYGGGDNTCNHFTGFDNRVCGVGMKYSEVVRYPLKHLGRMPSGMPCFRNCSYADGYCEAAKFGELESGNDVGGQKTDKKAAFADESENGKDAVSRDDT